MGTGGGFTVHTATDCFDDVHTAYKNRLHGRAFLEMESSTVSKSQTSRVGAGHFMRQQMGVLKDKFEVIIGGSFILGQSVPIEIKPKYEANEQAPESLRITVNILAEDYRGVPLGVLHSKTEKFVLASGSIKIEIPAKGGYLKFESKEIMLGIVVTIVGWKENSKENGGTEATPPTAEIIRGSTTVSAAPPNTPEYEGTDADSKGDKTLPLFSHYSFVCIQEPSLLVTFAENDKSLKEHELVKYEEKKSTTQVNLVQLSSIHHIPDPKAHIEGLRKAYPSVRFNEAGVGVFTKGKKIGVTVFMANVFPESEMTKVALSCYGPVGGPYKPAKEMKSVKAGAQYESTVEGIELGSNNGPCEVLCALSFEVEAQQLIYVGSLPFEISGLELPVIPVEADTTKK